MPAPHEPNRYQDDMPTRNAQRSLSALIATSAGVFLALAGCSSEADRAAAPLPSALEALGLRDVAYSKASAQGDTLTMTDVRANLPGGEVRIPEVVVKGFKASDTTWTAERIAMDRVKGAYASDRVVAIAPSAVKAGGVWTLAQGGLYADGAVAGRLLGTDAAARHVSRATSTDPLRPGTNYEADDLRLSGPTIPEWLSRAAWSIRARMTDVGPGKILLTVQRAETHDVGLASAVLNLVASQDAMSRLSGMDAATLSDLSRWPEGIALREMEGDVVLKDLPPGLPRPESARDPYLANVLSAAWDAVGNVGRPGQKGMGFKLRISPPASVPVRDIPTILTGTDAVARLGLTVMGDGFATPHADGRPIPQTTPPAR